MGQAAYKTKILKGGTPVSFTDEATTDLGSDKYQITDTTRQVLDRNSPVTVYDGITQIAESEVTIDYLFGTVTLENSPAGAVTIDGKYVPLAEIDSSYSYSLDISGDILDDTTFTKAQSSGGFRDKKYGMLDISISITNHSDLQKFFQDSKKDRVVLFVEIRPGGGPESARGWYVIEAAGQSGEVGSLEDETISLNLDGDGVGKDFSFQ